MQAARVFRTRVHVPREIGLLRAVRSRRRIREVVRVVGPARLRVDHVRALRHAVHTLPVGRRVAAVDRTRPVEARVAARDEVRMQVGDIPLGVGEQRVVRGVRVQLHHLQVLLQVLRLRATPRLPQRLERLLHEANGDPLAVGLAHDRTVMCAIDRELPLGHAVRGLEGDGHRLHLHRPLFVAVLVEQPSRPSGRSSPRTRRCCRRRSRCASTRSRSLKP